MVWDWDGLDALAVSPGFRPGEVAAGLGSGGAVA